MEISRQEKDGVIVMAIKGRLDASSATEAEKELNSLCSNDARLLLDLSGLEYISSAGLRVLLVVAKQIRHCGGKLCLCALTDSVMEVFNISGFSSIFNIAPDIDEAVEMLKG
ncbi:MAG: STAS domain-containing protein [Victivallales bacterium]|nr:STAS domain-containing protein [Victivallales bacterium]